MEMRKKLRSCLRNPNKKSKSNQMKTRLFRDYYKGNFSKTKSSERKPMIIKFLFVLSIY